MSKLDEIETVLANKAKLHDMPFREEDIADLCRYVRAAEALFMTFDAESVTLYEARKKLGLE
jgi:hypothetical protein